MLTHYVNMHCTIISVDSRDVQQIVDRSNILEIFTEDDTAYFYFFKAGDKVNAKRYHFTLQRFDVFQVLINACNMGNLSEEECYSAIAKLVHQMGIEY